MTKRKHIDLAKWYKENGIQQNWVHTVPASAFTFISANGVSLATTKRNYYRDSTADKIRYQTMDCSNASYDWLVDIFAEIYPGIFAFMGVASSDNITDKIESITLHCNALSNENIDLWRKSLRRI